MRSKVLTSTSPLEIQSNLIIPSEAEPKVPCIASFRLHRIREQTSPRSALIRV